MFRRLATLTLLGAALLSAETFKVNLAEPAMIGTNNLQPGNYLLQVEDSKATLTDKKGKVLATATKIESADTKYTRTAFAATKEGDKFRIFAIKVAGTTQKVVFE